MKRASLQCRCSQVVIAALAGLLFALPSSAVSPPALYRAVEATAGASVNSHSPPDSELSYSSSALGIFDESRQAHVVASGMGDSAEGTATAFQQSLVRH